MLDLLIRDKLTELENKTSILLHEQAIANGIIEDSDAWTVHLFYKFEKGQDFVIADEYRIKITYKPDDDAKQQRYEFMCTSHAMYWHKQICKAICAYVTKTQIENNLGGEINPEGMNIEEIADRLNIKLERRE